MDSPVSLSEAIDRYVSVVEGAGYSPNTLRAYSNRLNDFHKWIKDSDTEKNREPSALQSSATVQTYLAALRRRRIGRKTGVSDQTLAHAYAILSGFYNWLERTMSLTPNPIRDVIKPRGETSVDEEFKSLTLPQLDALLDTALNGWSEGCGPADLRSSNRRMEDWLIVAFMALAGLRVSEVCQLNHDDIVGDMVHVLGKGRKRRTVPLAPEILDKLKTYHAPNPGPHLFGAPRDNRRRITANSIQQRIPRLARASSILELRVTPHTLRHTFGSLMLAADPAALIPTRDLMGHGSVETTNKYAHTREEARRLALVSMYELRNRTSNTQ